MESIILTPRLKLTLLNTVTPGSPEFNSIHELRSNKQSSFWSLYGPSKSPAETEKALTIIMPSSTPPNPGEEKIFRLPYAVYILPSDKNTPATFIGLTTLRSLNPSETSENPRLGHASTPTTLSLELAYMFLPQFWGKGYATESINALLAACGKAPKEVWAPWEKVLVRAIVNDENVPSQRVMEKSGMGGMEVLEFEGGRFFIGGKWREEHRLYVYKRLVVGGE